MPRSSFFFFRQGCQGYSWPGFHPSRVPHQVWFLPLLHGAENVRHVLQLTTLLFCRCIYFNMPQGLEPLHHPPWHQKLDKLANGCFTFFPNVQSSFFSSICRCERNILLSCPWPGTAKQISSYSISLGLLIFTPLRNEKSSVRLQIHDYMAEV